MPAEAAMILPDLNFAREINLRVTEGKPARLLLEQAPAVNLPVHILADGLQTLPRCRPHFAHKFGAHQPEISNMKSNLSYLFRSPLIRIHRYDSDRLAGIAVQLVSLAPGRLHQPAFPADLARSRRLGSRDHRPGQCPLAPGEKSQSDQTDRDLPSRSPSGGPVVWLGSGRDAGRRRLPGVARHFLRGHQHGLPGPQSLPRRRRLRHDDRARQNSASGPRHGGSGENSGHGQNAARLG